jgi:hypothetical protein
MARERQKQRSWLFCLACMEGCGPSTLAPRASCARLCLAQILPRHAQVCLAAEKCGHLGFDSRADMWWSSEGFHCGDTPAGEVSFLGILLKVSKLAVGERTAAHCVPALSSLLCCPEPGKAFAVWASPGLIPLVPWRDQKGGGGRTPKTCRGAGILAMLLDERLQGWTQRGWACRLLQPSIVGAPLQVLPAAVLWGAGTAMGEIPPYAVAYHAARAGFKNADVEKFLTVRLVGRQMVLFSFVSLSLLARKVEFQRALPSVAFLLSTKI